MGGGRWETRDCKGSQDSTPSAKTQLTGQNSVNRATIQYFVQKRIRLGRAGLDWSRQRWSGRDPYGRDRSELDWAEVGKRGQNPVKVARNSSTGASGQVENRGTHPLSRNGQRIRQNEWEWGEAPVRAHCLGMCIAACGDCLHTVVVE